MQKISRSVTVQNLASGQYDRVFELLPTKIEQALEQPKIFELVLSTLESSVIAQLEFMLIDLASLMSVGGNLNKAQVPFIARHILEIYPNESLADFKICFQRGAIGSYGEIQRLDGITIRGWITKYLDEKYTIVEDLLMREKENLYSIRTDIPEDINRMLETYKQSIKSIDVRAIPTLTDEEAGEEGQPEPKKKKYIQNDNAPYLSAKKIEYGRLYSDKVLLNGGLVKDAPLFSDWLKHNP